MCARYCIEYKNISGEPRCFQLLISLAVVIWYEGQSYEGMFLKKKFKYFRSRSLFYLDKLAELFARDIISDNTNEVILNSPCYEGN